MQLRTIERASLIAVLGLLSGWIPSVGWAADNDPAFRTAKQTFQVQMRKKVATDRVAAIAAFAAFENHEAADLIIKRGCADVDPTVRQAAQVAVRRLAAKSDIRKALVDELTRGIRKPVISEAVPELLRALVCTEDAELQTILLKLLDDYLTSPKGDLLLPMTLIDDFGKQGDAEAFRAVTLFSRSKAFDAKFGYCRCVIQAMSQIRDAQAVEWLILLIPKSQGLIQHDIIQYLTKLTSLKLGDNDRAWYKWWHANKDQIEFPKGGVSTEDVALTDGQQTYYGIPVCAKRIVFVLDTSGSMRGSPLYAAKTALLQVVDSLPESVNFDVVMFDKTVTVWQPRLIPASRQAKTELKSTVQNRGMQSGTVSFAAIEAAFKLEPEAIYFLSDGQPTDSQPDQIFNTFSTLNRTRRVSLHTIGVVTDKGNAASLILFMKPLAERNYGSYRLVD